MCLVAVCAHCRGRSCGRWRVAGAWISDAGLASLLTLWEIQRLAAGTRKLEAAEEGGFPSPEAVADRFHMSLAA